MNRDVVGISFSGYASFKFGKDFFYPCTLMLTIWKNVICLAVSIVWLSLSACIAVSIVWLHQQRFNPHGACQWQLKKGCFKLFLSFSWLRDWLDLLLDFLRKKWGFCFRNWNLQSWPFIIWVLGFSLVVKFITWGIICTYYKVSYLYISIIVPLLFQ